MAYDNDAPADNILIRLLPAAVRDNFQAITSGDTTFSQDYINIDQVGSNPANVASTFRLFSKSSGGNSELFGINSGGTVYQFTGNTSAADPGYTVINGLITINWGTVSSFAATSPPSKVITFPKAYTTNNYSVTFSTIASNGVDVDHSYSKTSGSQMTVYTTTGSNPFLSYIAIGPS